MLSFQHDLSTTFIPGAIRYAGEQFCDLPENVKIAVVSAVYRGDLGDDTPKTSHLMRTGQWCKVPAEYLDHGDYKTCHQKGLAGICTRMDWNAEQFRTMCKNS